MEADRHDFLGAAGAALAVPHMSGKPAGNTHCVTTFGFSLPIDMPMNEFGPMSMPVDRRYSS
jgi:hypothetical protein